MTKVMPRDASREMREEFRNAAPGVYTPALIQYMVIFVVYFFNIIILFFILKYYV